MARKLNAINYKVYIFFKKRFFYEPFAFTNKKTVMKSLPIVRITIFILGFSFAVWACANNYYTAKPVTPASKYPSAINKARKDKRYFIMQSGINIYSVTSVDLDDAKQQITVTLDKVDSSHLVYLTNPEVRRSKAKEGEKPVRSEIRLYMKDSASYTLDEPHTIPLAKVGRVELLD